MILFSILAMTCLVFASRYLFLEPRLPVRLNTHMVRLLRYASPAVLTAIWAPIVFTPEGSLNLSGTNPYLLAAAVAVLLAWWAKNVLFTTVVSMAGFLWLKFGVF